MRDIYTIMFDQEKCRDLKTAGLREIFCCEMRRRILKSGVNSTWFVKYHIFIYQFQF
jgi:hypothetical protein